MSYKGSRHRVGSYTDYQKNLEEIRANVKNVTGKPCDKHKEFNKYCVKCWEVTENKPNP
jgi:hypothetical protein